MLRDRRIQTVVKRDGESSYKRFSPGETSCLSLVWAVLDLFSSHASKGANL
jgi:hypothetical protein